MFIHFTAHYLPKTIIPNAYFTELNGLTDEWLESRTGIKERRKASENEDLNTMAIAAVDALKGKMAFDLSEIDLIVGATYTPADTVVTHAHVVQQHLDISDIPVVCASSACSSLLNAIEIVQGYFALKKATKALVVAAEHNTAYSHEKDPKSGHLWGDGATAIVMTSEKIQEGDFEVLDLFTAGAGNVGNSLTGVNLFPRSEGLIMLNGRDVFIHACNYMAKASTKILDQNGLKLEDMSYLITHQANLRITRNVVEKLEIPEEKVLVNLPYLGNTGCAGCGIALSENWEKFKREDNVVFSVFGGGYSYGAMLARKT